MHVAAGTAWSDVLARAIAATPEAFDQGRPRNLVEGEWRSVATPTPVTTPVAGTVLTALPRLDFEAAQRAVAASAQQHREWAATPLDERKSRVSAAPGALTAERGLLTL